MSLAHHSRTKTTQSPGQGIAAQLSLVEEEMLRAITSGSGPGAGAERAARYHLSSGGGRTRATLGLASSLKLGLSQRKAIPMAAAVELLHNASLLHDDVQDKGLFRRGRASAAAHFGTGVAICAGDLMIGAAYAVLAKYPDSGKLPALLVRMQERVAETIAGQTLDLEARGQSLARYSHYERIAAAKSGPLLGLGLELSMIAGGCASETQLAAQAAREFAVAYQILDDIEDEHEDGAGADNQSILNAVSVMRAAETEHAHAALRTQALRALERSEIAVAALPRACGDCLQGHIEKLREKLQLWH